MPSTVANALGEARVVVLEKPVAVDIKVRDPRPVERCERVLKGGQMPLHRRLPKRGFNNARHTTYFIPVNVSDLDKFDADAEITLDVLRQAGLAQGSGEGVKILGQGSLSKN